MVRKRLNLPRKVVTPLAWQAPFAIAVAFPRSKTRDAAIYAAQMFAYLGHYAMPYDDEQALMRRLRVDYPVRIDRAIGLGEVPTCAFSASSAGRARYGGRTRSSRWPIGCGF